jgi:tRNA(Ile)-lysidine synthetase-like protein
MSSASAYVVAVSGGVDSVTLLDLLAKSKEQRVKSNEWQSLYALLGTDYSLVVAHFDHGIRKNSARDRQFVEALAKKYKLTFECAEGKLGPNASEAEARAARYKFLRRVQKKYQAEAIITAHHQDDVIETAILNLLRGTYRKGLSSLKSRPGILRPLIDVKKLTIVSFANRHGLHWREDPSNTDTKYLRNYVRYKLIPKLDVANPDWRENFLSLIKRGGQLNRRIDQLLQPLAEDYAKPVEKGWVIKRQQLLNLPRPLAHELLLTIFKRGSPLLSLSASQLKKALLFCKTARPGARLQLNKQTQLRLDRANVLVLTKTSP